MGSGAWSGTEYTTRSATYRTKSRQELFASKIARDFDPQYISMRESCDSEDSPESTALIFGLDVTGSMGFIAEHIAKESLGTLVQGILDTQPVSDPHIMMMGIGDINSDQAPLQVTQFEADIRIADQLTNIWLEGNGGGNNYESYDLPWIFAANKTEIDCFKKRDKKGYLFTIGDELPPRPAAARILNQTCNLQVQSNLTTEEALSAAQETFEVFHVIVEEGSFARRNLERVKNDWTELLQGRVIMLNDYTHISEVMLSVIRVNEGENPQEVIASWQDPEARDAVQYSLTA